MIDEEIKEEEKPIIRFNIPSRLRILFNLINIRGRHTLGEIVESCGMSTERNECYKFLYIIIKLGILKRDGEKLLSFKPYPTYRVDEEVLAEFVETNEELKSMIDNLDHIRSVIWGDIFSGVKRIFKKPEKKHNENFS